MARNSRSIIVAVKGIIVHEGYILLVRRAEGEAAGAGAWEYPGGKIEFGETLEHALEREIKEETGLDAAIGALVSADSLLTDPARQLVILTYLCRTPKKAVQLSKEHTDYKWCNVQELPSLLPPGSKPEVQLLHELGL